MDYAEHPGSDAMAFLAERALASEIDRNLANRKVVREDRAACARKGRR